MFIQQRFREIDWQEITAGSSLCPHMIKSYTVTDKYVQIEVITDIHVKLYRGLFLYELEVKIDGGAESCIQAM